MTDTIDIPEFKGSEGSKAPKNNFTPINPKSGDVSSGGFLAKLPLGRNAIIGLAMFLILGMSGLGYFVFTGTQETSSDAASPICKYKPQGKNCNLVVDVPGCPTDPGGVLVQCSDDSYWCALPNQTFEVCGDYCKKVNTCTLKCRKPGEVEKIVQLCGGTTPTPPTEKTCPDSTFCTDDPVLCANSGQNLNNTCKTSSGTEGCCASKTTPTPTPVPRCEPPYVCTAKGDLPPTDEEIQKYCQVTNNTPTSPRCTLDGGGDGYCCNIPTPTVGPSETPTPTVACVLPKISVTVECETCNQ